MSILRGDQDEEVASYATRIIQALLSSIPNFWGSSEFLQVITLYLDTCVSSRKPRTSAQLSLIKVVAKKAPSKLLLGTLCDLWPSLRSEVSSNALRRAYSLILTVGHRNKDKWLLFSAPKSHSCWRPLSSFRSLALVAQSLPGSLRPLCNINYHRSLSMYSIITLSTNVLTLSPG